MALSAIIPTVGLRNVGSYQVSGHPYITGSLINNGSEVRVQFPFVTKEFTVISSGTLAGGPTLRVHFLSAGALFPGELGPIGGHHFTTLDAARESVTFDTKCTEIFITCPAGGGGNNGFEVVASLTNIHTGNMYPLTGSGLTT